MTTDEAIELLNQIHLVDRTYDHDATPALKPYNEALDMAIDALNRERWIPWIS